MADVWLCIRCLRPLPHAADWEAGLGRLGEITGRPVGSSKELSFLEAERVKKELA